MVPLLYAHVLPLIRLTLRHRPVLRDRLFLVSWLEHWAYLVCQGKDAGRMREELNHREGWAEEGDQMEPDFAGSAMAVNLGFAAAAVGSQSCTAA